MCSVKKEGEEEGLGNAKIQTQLEKSRRYFTLDTRY